MFWIFGCGYTQNLVYSEQNNGLEVLQKRVENSCQEMSETRNFLCDEGMKVVLQCMETTQSICYRNQKKIAHVSVGTCVWTYTDWDFFARLSINPP
jgi:hypothetical protein